MSRLTRALLVAGGTLLALALGAIYPVVAKKDAWLHAEWGGTILVVILIVALVTVVPYVVWKMTLGKDLRVPQLSLPTVAPLFSGPRGFRAGLRDIPGILRGAALVFGLVALIRPQNVLEPERSEQSGIDIYLLLDMSGSMQAVMEGPSNSLRTGHRPTRFETAKEVIIDFISRRKSDRIGVVVFGGAAFLLSPSTFDYQLLSKLVRDMNIGQIDAGQTAIGDAITTAVARLKRSDARSKAIVLMTDGDSNAGSVDPLYAAHLAESHGVRLYTVQIGNGDEVDVEDPNGPDIFGNPRYQRRRFPVNPDLLQKIAKETGGQDFIATDRRGLEKSMHDILDHLETTRFVASSKTSEDLFPFLLPPMMILVALEALTRLVVVRRFP